MCNKIGSEHFAVWSAKWVVVFQASLKLLSEEAEPNSQQGVQHPEDQNRKEETAKKKWCINLEMKGLFKNLVR